MNTIWNAQIENMKLAASMSILEICIAAVDAEERILSAS